jgi:hypothetical protein
VDVLSLLKEDHRRVGVMIDPMQKCGAQAPVLRVPLGNGLSWPPLKSPWKT